MIKRIIAIAIAFTIAFSLAACSETKNAEGDGVISPMPKDGKPELTILMHTTEYQILTQTKYIKDYIDKFKMDFGVDIKLVKIGDSINSNNMADHEAEYIKKMSIKLYPKEGPELIFTRYMSMEALIDQGAVIDMRGKVANIDKIYDSLLSDRVYYAPLGIFYMSRIISRYALAQLNTEEPSLNWTSMDYFDIRDKWVSKNKPLFNAIEYEQAFQRFIDLRSLSKAKENKIVLNTPEVRQKISDVRNYIFGGKYQLMNGYKYENYYNMLFEETSEESKLSWQYINKNMANGHIENGIGANLFRAKSVQDSNRSNGTVMYPQFKDREAFIYSYGFLINKNGKNLNLAYEFINGLLTDEIQMGMFQDKEFFSGESIIADFYPVNKEIEADILKLESQYELDPKAIQLKAYVLKELKDGRCRLITTTNYYDYKIMSEIYKELTKLILADNPYTDEQLQFELKRMEDKYNIYLNE